LWELAILKGYAAFRELKEAKRGLVIADMAERDLRFEALP